MAINSAQKAEIVEKVNQVSKEATLALAIDYHGLTANEMNDLRKQAKQEKVVIYVVKNTLARRALEETPYECFNDGLAGPVALVFSTEDVPAAARLIKDFSKDHDSLEVKLVALAGELRDVSEVDRLASLPSREQAIALLMAVMKEPIAKLARVLIAPHTKLVRTIDAVRISKE